MRFQYRFDLKNIVDTVQTYASNCKLPNGTARMQIYNNSAHTPSGKLNVCGITFKEWQQKGNNPGTMIYAVLTDENKICKYKYSN